jgi:hypothetical protein
MSSQVKGPVVLTEEAGTTPKYVLPVAVLGDAIGAIVTQNAAALNLPALVA